MTKFFPPRPISFLRAAFNRLGLLVLFIFSANPAFAHNPLSSWAVAQLHPDHLELKVELAADSAWLFLGETLDAAPQVKRELPRMRAKAAGIYRVSLNGQILSPRETGVALREEDGVEFRLIFDRPATGPLLFEATYLRLLPSEHRTILTLLDEQHQTVRSEILNSSKPSVALILPPPVGATTAIAEPGNTVALSSAAGMPPSSSPTVSFQAFLFLGIEHIITGYDHLLFLCALLIACRRPKSMIVIVTCFTVAHSITLALAALNMVNIPASIVEPLIAVSIIFVGLENLLRREEPKGRWLLTFGFGLIHGFGFAGALREAGLGSAGSALAMPLFSFNLGVELGQLAVIGVLLPVYLKTRDRPAFTRFVRPAISGLVVIAGTCWLLQRTLLG